METLIKCPKCGCDMFVPLGIVNTEIPNTNRVLVHFKCEKCGEPYDYVCSKDAAPIVDPKTGVVEYRDPSWVEDYPDLVDILEDEGMLDIPNEVDDTFDGGFDPDIG